MSSFDEYRKKLANKYGTSSTKKKDEEEESQQVKSSSSGSTATAKTNSSAASKPKTSFDEYREKLNAKYRTDKVDEKGVDKWFSDADKAFKSIQDGKDKDPVSTVNTLLDSSNEVYNYFLNHKDEIEDFETWEKALSDYRSALTKYDKYYYQQERSIPDEYKGKGYYELKEMLNTMEKGSEEYNWLRSYAPYTVMGADDFDEYSKKGASIENPSMKDAEGWAYVFGNRLGAKKVGNIVTYSRDNYEDIAVGEANNGMLVGSSLYHYMTDDEVNIYNYLLAKNGEEEAQEYLDSLTETLNYRSGTEQAERVRGIENDVLRTLATGVYGVGAGADQAATGIKQLFSKEALPTTSAQFASAYIREDLADTGPKILGNSLGQMLYDAVTTTSNMVPSILVGALTGMPVVGAATLGASAGGNAYGQALKEGYTPEQARNYGILIGASETALQYLLGGISSMGGKVTGKTVQTTIQNIDNALLRAAADIGINMASEGMEEYIQEILDPVYRNLLLGEDNEFKLVSEDAAYSFILGALTAGVMEGTPAVTRYVGETAALSDVYGADVGALVGESLEINPENKFAQKMQGRLDEGRKISGGQISTLINQNERGMATNDMNAITEAATSRLSELGETGDVNAIGAAVAKQAAGRKLTRAERQTISNSRYGQRVANELNTKNINAETHSSAWAEKIGTNRINPEEYNRLVAEAETTQESAETSADTIPTPTQNVPQSVNTEAVKAPSVTVPEEVESVSLPEESTQVEEAEEVTSEVDDNENVITIEEASKKYGAQAGAMVHTYHEGQDVAKYDAAYEQAYNMGQSGVSLSYAMNSESTAYLTETQRELAYKAGKAASDTAATEKDAVNRQAANGKTGWKKGAVRGDGVTISDLKKSFNDTQNTAYKLLSAYAEATGIDIVLYRSKANADGRYEEAQGKYRHSEPGTVYIDINAGLSGVKSVNDLAKYTMLRTFAHEFTHFIENWNPVQYNEFRKLVFDTLTERGENVEDLIDEKQATTPDMNYDKASREVVAEAMTDILPDANFVEELANNHKTIFDKLIEKLKEFVATLREYFNSIGHNRSREANALKEQIGDAVHYVESIVKLFDSVAVQAVENYQLTVTIDEVTGEATVVETKVEPEVAEATEPITEEVETIPEAAPEVPFDKRIISLLKGSGRVAVTELDGQKYITNGSIVLPITSEAAEKYAYTEFNALRSDFNEAIKKTLAGANTLITKAPVEGKGGRESIYIFDENGKKMYFAKKLMSYIDGGLLYYGDFPKGGYVIKSVGEDGSIKGYLLSMKEVKDSALTDRKPSKLKSFSKKMQALIDAQTAKPIETVAKAPVPVLEKILKDNPVRSTADDSEQYQSRAYLGEDRYSYEWFVNKPDMAVTTVDDSVKYTRADIVSLALKNAASVGYTNQNGNAVVHVEDIDTDVIVPKRSLVHGLDRRMNTQAPVLVEIGNVLKNSIRINELVPRAVEIKNAYVLIGAAQNQDGNLYIASFVVNKYSNEVSEIDVLYSANAKKESAALLPKITDKSATPTDSVISIARLLEYVNSYFPDVLPESVLKHFGHDARPEGTIGEDALFQQRTSTLTNREILAMAAGDINIGELNAGEQEALNIFQKHLSRLEELQEKRTELGRLYKEQQFGENGDREAAAETLARMHILDERIRSENNDLFTIEEKAVLRRILEKARKVVEQTEREHGKEILRRWRDRRNKAEAIKKYRERLRRDVDELTNWVLHPNNKDVVKHIPDALKNSVIPFLSSIDFMSKRALKGGEATIADKKFISRLNDLKATLKPHLDVDDMYNAYTDLPPNFMDRLDNFITSVQTLVENNSGDFVINQMTAEELRELYQVVHTLREYITNFNKFHANAMFKHVYEAGDDTINALRQMKNAGVHTGNISNFVLWQQIRPAYAFERFGKGGKAIYDGLRRGQATLAFNTKKIQEFAEKAYTAAEVKTWEKEIKEIRLGKDIIRMPVSTIMSFYELSKRPQALGHIFGEGIRIATFKANGKKISDIGHTVTAEDVQTIIETLTPRQKEVSDALQKFMQEQGGKWGNYVSVKRFGEELFGEEHYFPINSDGRHLSANADEHPTAASLYALLNMGFTKSTQEGANNRLVLYSIFDVFANHMASMAQYNAFALPVVDAIKWFNYRQKSEPDENGVSTLLDSVRDQMDRVYGVPEETRPGSGRQGYAQTFVINILKAFNGTEAQGVPTDTTGLNKLRRYNMAQVAFNLRVVMQQPMAITRAAQILDYRSIIKGMTLNPKAIQRNIAEMQTYSGIAAWKSLGFYDINISRGLTEIIKHRSTIRDKISNAGMWGAEKADLMTWAAMWSAAKQEVIRKQKLTPKSEGFYEAVTELFEEVIYKTQVVDSVLTKNEFLRSKGFFSRAIGSFMSESTATASMLVNAYDKYHADIQRGFSKQKAWNRNKNRIVRTAYVYGISAVTLAAVQAVADALRDDDDYMTFMEKWLDAFKGNAIDELIPVNKLPLLSDVYELSKELLSVFGVDTYGNAPQSVIMQWWDVLTKGFEIIRDKTSGEDTDYTWYGGAYKLLQAVSGMTGLPMAATTRELISAWNNIFGRMAPSLKVKTYEPSEQAKIQYAYLDGYLTAEEATKELIEKGVVDTEDEAYFTIAEWGDPDGSYSRYDNLYDAARNGGNFDAAVDELVSHGYTEKDVLSQLKGEIGKWYKNGDISKQQAIDMLTKHFDLDREEITAIVNKWSSKVVTGVEFNDIKDEYLSGDITASRAAEMYARYGGYTKSEAKQKVAEWDFEEEHGFTYGSRGEQFKEGNISGTELVEMIVDFGGKSEDEARTSLVGYAKSGYEEGYFTSKEAVNMMVEYGGLTKAEAEAKIQHVDFQREYPGYELSEAQVTTYYDELEHTGLGVPEYAEYLERRKESKGVDTDGDGKTDSGSVKAEVMVIIDSLPITIEQKDALYYLNGWAESRIYEAPWH